jgi:RNA polymerase sigma-70 factor (ECF subfamily)
MHSWQELQVALRGFFSRRVATDDVDDLLQECFLRVQQGLPTLRDQERLGAWVFQIARNLVVDHRRRQRSQLGEGTIDEDPAAEPDDPNLNVRVGEWLASMIQSLPANYSEVLLDSELREIPYREIADRLGLSVSGVKSRVQRGREMLRERLLACCALELDRRGRVRGYERRTRGSCDC